MSAENTPNSLESDPTLLKSHSASVLPVSSSFNADDTVIDIPDSKQTRKDHHKIAESDSRLSNSVPTNIRDGKYRSFAHLPRINNNPDGKKSGAKIPSTPVLVPTPDMSLHSSSTSINDGADYAEDSEEDEEEDFYYSSNENKNGSFVFYQKNEKNPLLKTPVRKKRNKRRVGWFCLAFFIILALFSSFSYWFLFNRVGFIIDNANWYTIATSQNDMFFDISMTFYNPNLEQVTINNLILDIKISSIQNESHWLQVPHELKSSNDENLSGGETKEVIVTTKLVRNQMSQELSDLFNSHELNMLIAGDTDYKAIFLQLSCRADKKRTI